MSALTQPIATFFTSSIGRKTLVALTGLVLVLFVLGHMIGNLLVFAGPDAINAYGEFLREVGHGMGLWVARIGLLAAVGIHIWLTIQLTRENNAARERYGFPATLQAPRSSLIMIWSGITILAFIIYHLMHFTLRVGNDYSTYFATLDGKQVHDVYRMVIAGFSWWPASLFYIIAMGLLCSHLSHGVGSMFQTIGWNTEKTRPWFRCLSLGYAALIFIGNCSIPLAVLLGLIKFK
jgi:succinate dehydrogenase / fumarate reductase cytochrome b subunit